MFTKVPETSTTDTDGTHGTVHSRPRSTYRKSDESTTAYVRWTYGRRTGDVGSVEIGSNDIHGTCVSEITM